MSTDLCRRFYDLESLSKEFCPWWNCALLVTFLHQRQAMGHPDRRCTLNLGSLEEPLGVWEPHDAGCQVRTFSRKGARGIWDPVRQSGTVLTWPSPCTGFLTPSRPTPAAGSWHARTSLALPAFPELPPCYRGKKKGGVERERNHISKMILSFFDPRACPDQAGGFMLMFLLPNGGKEEEPPKDL